MKLKLIECKLVQFTKIGPRSYIDMRISFIHSGQHHTIYPRNNYRKFTIKL